MTKPIRTAIRFLAAAALTGCAGSGAPGGDGGSGGTSPGGSAGGGEPSGGSSGVTSSGGVAGSAGSTETGGSSSGGIPSTGGVAGSGGSAETGGSGSGGIAGTGNSAGSGAGSGGAAGRMQGGAAGMAGASCAPATLKAAGDCSGRLVGAALAASHLSESAYAQAAREHNYVTPENEMKWGSIQPSRGSFSFGPADQIVNFAQQNGMRVKGHALVWHNQLPAWVSSLTSPADVRAAMVDHIESVMEHFRGKVVAWDVVNEAYDDDAGASLRDSVFSRQLGSGFIDEAFRAARAADADVKLYYNDYDTENLGAKSNAVYEMVQSMVERGVPIDGVGLQMHLRIPDTEPSLDELRRNMQRIADLGLEVLISEMDVRWCNGETEAQQVSRFHDVVALCVAQPKCPAVTFWGITDRYSWLNDAGSPSCPSSERPRGLLWDDNYMKKNAYNGVLDALSGR